MKMNCFSTTNWNRRSRAFPIPLFKVKVIFFCAHHEGPWGSRFIIPLFPNLSYMEISNHLHHVPDLIAKERNPIHMNRRLGGLQCLCQRFGKEIKFLPVRVIEARSLRYEAHSLVFMPITLSRLLRIQSMF